MDTLFEIVVVGVWIVTSVTRSPMNIRLIGYENPSGWVIQAGGLTLSPAGQAAVLKLSRALGAAISLTSASCRRHRIVHDHVEIRPTIGQDADVRASGSPDASHLARPLAAKKRSHDTKMR
jgi:hypothetical protein